LQKIQTQHHHTRDRPGLNRVSPCGLALSNRERRAVLIQDVLREETGITQLAFRRLLAWLDDGVDSNGEQYLEMRRRLVSFFDRRSRPAADDLADETLNRVSRTLEQTGLILTRPPARYCYVVARFVLLEDLRRERKHIPLHEPWNVDVARGAARTGPDEGVIIREQRLDCLDRCLQELKPEQRDLIIEYYADARRQKIERRRGLAKRLGITMNGLGIRAWRIRERLTACVEGCRHRRRQI
jgi:DNA-directed RNA polymerase specialized sigma24 family protein